MSGETKACSSSLNGEEHFYFGRTTPLDTVADLNMDITETKVSPFNLDSESSFGVHACAAPDKVAWDNAPVTFWDVATCIV